MHTPTASHQAHLKLDLHFELHLCPGGPQPVWHARLAGDTPERQLHFESMGELIRYLARLDLQPPPPRGIR
jgi:hypothetical protein